MAEKKKAYRRFEELTRQVTAPTPTEAEPDRGSMDLRGRGGAAGMESPPGEELPIRLSPEMRRALEQHAAAEETTPSEIVQDALRRYLESPR